MPRETKKEAIEEALQAFEQGREINAGMLPAWMRPPFLKAAEFDRTAYENRHKEQFQVSRNYNWITGYTDGSPSFFITNYYRKK